MSEGDGSARARDGVEGDALYAMVHIQTGGVVVSSATVTAFSEARWAKHREKRSLPEDAAIKVYGASPSMLTDWLAGRTKPIWYYLNHSSSPNTKVVANTYLAHSTTPFIQLGRRGRARRPEKPGASSSPKLWISAWCILSLWTQTCTFSSLFMKRLKPRSVCRSGLRTGSGTCCSVRSRTGQRRLRRCGCRELRELRRHRCASRE